MKNKIINLTPHPINILNDENQPVKTYPASSQPVRLKQVTKRVGAINGIPISKTFFGETEFLPSYQEGVFYIVSRMVMAKNPHHKGLLVPNEVVREGGQTIGCKSLASN